eukprot:sb/3469034/
MRHFSASSAVGSSSSKECAAAAAKKSRLALFIRAPAPPGSKSVEYMCPPNRTVFSCLVEMTAARTGYLPNTYVRRLWEPTYTLVYREVRSADKLRLQSQETDPIVSGGFKPKWELEYVRRYLGSERLPKLDLINYLQAYGDSVWLRKWRLNASARSVKKCKSCSSLSNIYRDFVQHTAAEKQTSETNEWYEEFSQCLSLLELLHGALKAEQEGGEGGLAPETFHSSRLTTRLMQQVIWVID